MGIFLFGGINLYVSEELVKAEFLNSGWGEQIKVWCGKKGGKMCGENKCGGGKNRGKRDGQRMEIGC